MKKEMKIVIPLGLAFFIGAAIANVETPYPLGTSDLVRDKRVEEFKPKEIKIEPIRWTWDAESVELVYEENDSTLSQFKFADQLSVAELQIENQKLRKKVAELELRLSRLEKLHEDEERTSR